MTRRNLIVALTLASLACGGDGPNEPAAPPTLTLITAPATARTEAPLTPAIVIRAQRGGTAAANFSGNVTAAIDSGTGILQGTTTVRASNGEAAFNDLRIAGVGRFVLRFSAAGAPDIRSNGIVVSPDSGARLAVRTAPSNAVLTGSQFATQPVIEVRGASGTTVSYPVVVTATLVRGNGVLTGTTSTTSSAGVAAFSGLGAQGFSGVTLRFSAFGFLSVDVAATIQILGLFVRPWLPNERDTITVAQDTPLDVPVRFVMGANDVVGSARFDVVWDPRFLMLLSEQAAGGDVSILVNRTQAAEGVLQVSATSSTGLRGAADVIVLRFRTARLSGEGPISTRILEVRSPDGRDIFRSNVSSTVRVLIP
ncbi:MAG: hypothetical protein ACT4R6_07405 [Gemmatimonadaceae bacterium]